MRRLRPLVGAFVLVLAAAGCSGGPASNATTSLSPSQPAVTPLQSLIAVTTATPAAPASTANPSQPTFNQHQYPDLEAVLPATVGGAKPTTASLPWSVFSQIMTATTPLSKAETAWLGALGPAANVKVAAATYQPGNGPLLIVVVRVSGATPTSLLKPLTDALLVEKLTPSEKTISGKTVTFVADKSDGDHAAYFYAKGDTGFNIESQNPALVAEALSKLP